MSYRSPNNKIIIGSKVPSNNAFIVKIWSEDLNKFIDVQTQCLSTYKGSTVGGTFYNLFLTMPEILQGVNISKNTFDVQDETCSRISNSKIMEVVDNSQPRITIFVYNDRVIPPTLTNHSIVEFSHYSSNSGDGYNAIDFCPISTILPGVRFYNLALSPTKKDLTFTLLKHNAVSLNMASNNPKDWFVSCIKTKNKITTPQQWQDCISLYTSQTQVGYEVIGHEKIRDGGNIIKYIESEAFYDSQRESFVTVGTYDGSQHRVDLRGINKEVILEYLRLTTGRCITVSDLMTFISQRVQQKLSIDITNDQYGKYLAGVRSIGPSNMATGFPAINVNSDYRNIEKQKDILILKPSSFKWNEDNTATIKGIVNKNNYRPELFNPDNFFYSQVMDHADLSMELLKPRPQTNNSFHFTPLTIPSTCHQKENEMTKPINLTTLVALAQTKVSDEFTKLSSVVPGRLGEKILALTERKEEEKMEAAAETIVNLINESKEQIDKSVEAIRQARRLISNEKAKIEAIEQATAFGAETMNYLPLFKCVVQPSRSIEHEQTVLTEVPEDFKKKYEASKAKTQTASIQSTAQKKSRK